MYFYLFSHSRLNATVRWLYIILRHLYISVVSYMCYILYFKQLGHHVNLKLFRITLYLLYLLIYLNWKMYLNIFSQKVTSLNNFEKLQCSSWMRRCIIALKRVSYTLKLIYVCRYKEEFLSVANHEWPFVSFVLHIPYDFNF